MPHIMSDNGHIDPFSIKNQRILQATQPMWSNLTLKELAFLIRLFPDCHLPQDVLFETAGEKKIINTYRHAYKGISVCFEYLAEEKELSPDVFRANYNYYQPYAELFAAQLKLLEGVHPRSVLSDYFESPLYAWGSFIYSHCRNQLNNSGLLGKPLIYGKTKAINNNSKRLRRYDKREITAIPSDNHQTNKPHYSWYESPEDCLTDLASAIAQQDPKFDKGCWVPYRKKVSQHDRNIKNCRELQSEYLLPNGDVFMTGKRKKIPKQFKSTKGFGHS